MFHTLRTTLGYKQGALQKKPLIAYFLDRFKKIKKVIYVYFQFYNPKLS